MKHLSRASYFKSKSRLYDEFTRFHGWPKIPLNFAISKGGDFSRFFFSQIPKWTFPHLNICHVLELLALDFLLTKWFFKQVHSITTACHAVPIKVCYFKYAYQRLFHEFRGRKRSTITLKKKYPLLPLYKLHDQKIWDFSYKTYFGRMDKLSCKRLKLFLDILPQCEFRVSTEIQ